MLPSDTVIVGAMSAIGVIIAALVGNCGQLTALFKKTLICGASHF
jgi:hypothetical protein